MSKTYKVFYFEDEEKVYKPIKDFLENPVQGPVLQVTHYADARNALDEIDDKWDAPPDVVLLDREQANYTNAGIDICKKIKKKWPPTPVVFLSQFAGIHDQYEGFDAQANIYLSKDMLLKDPNHKGLIHKILVGQISYVCTIRNTPEDEYVNGSLKVNMGLPTLWWRDKELSGLTPDNMAIVHELAQLKKRGDTRTYLTLAIAGDLRGDEDLLKDNLRKRISNIRKAFQKVDQDFNEACMKKRHGIIAVPGVGYKWKSDVPAARRLSIQQGV